MLLPRGGGSEWDRIGRRARRAEFAPVGVHDDSRRNRNRGNAPSSPAAGLNGCRRRSAAGAACIGDLGETAMGVFGRFGSAAFVGILVDRRTRAGVWRRRRRDLAPSHLRPQYKCESVTTHNARHQRTLEPSMPFRECAQSSWVLIVKSGGLSAEFDEGDGLKNRCRFERKSWIRQVLISRTLTDCGEVAERLKAAVC
jgi:hypothetical protein